MSVDDNPDNNDIDVVDNPPADDNPPDDNPTADDNPPADDNPTADNADNDDIDVVDNTDDKPLTDNNPPADDVAAAPADDKPDNINASSGQQQSTFFLKRKIPTNQYGQATRLWLLHCHEIQIRVFHITWFTFWLCFFGWFATANLWKQIQEDLGLTKVHKAIAGGCSVASTVVFRVIVGWICQRWGSRKTYVPLLCVSAIPVCCMALVTSPAGYIIDSLLIGIVGASFVITQFHTTSMFAGKVVGTANATSAGWGNFGGGCANFFMPILYFHFKNTYDLSNSTAWRVCMLVPGLLYIVLAVIYWFFTVDKPPSNVDRVVSQDLDDVADDPANIELQSSGAAAADKRSGGFKVGATDYRTWILFLVYAACFGIELTVLRFAVSYFTGQFGVEQEMAGFIILCFSFCNLFARSLGGLVADLTSKFSSKSLTGRVYALFIILLVESVFLILFSLGDEVVGNLGYTIFMMIMFSLCVQAAEGATFAVVPFVQPKAIGPVAGIVGAGGNMGAMIFAFAIFTNVPDAIAYQYAWLILGIFVFCVSWMTLCIKFSDEEIRAADEKMNTWNDIEVDEK